jgi:hypothetical protein
MATFSVFRWLDGPGWLVFSGSAGGDIRALALGRIAADGAVVVIAVAGGLGAADDALSDLIDLGAPAGFIVDLATDDDETVRDRIGQAGFVLITGNASTSEAYSVLMGAAVEAAHNAYRNGAVILVEGAAAGAFGTVLASGQTAQGFNWVEPAVLVTADAGADHDLIRHLLSVNSSLVAVRIGRNSAIAFGGDDQVETWGANDVSIVLGAQYQR